MPRVSKSDLAAAALVVAAGLAASSSTASAAFITPTTWARPTTSVQASATHTTYNAWDVFNDDDTAAAGVQDTTPDLGNVNPNGPGSVVSPNGVLLGSGNLYTFDQPINVTATVPSYNLGAGYSTSILLQVRTQGNPLLNTGGSPDLSNFTVNGTPLATYAKSLTLTQVFTNIGSPQGATIDNIFAFTVPGNAASYAIGYHPPDSSVSQQVISVDTAAVVPEPTTLAAFGGLAIAGLMRRRPQA